MVPLNYSLVSGISCRFVVGRRDLRLRAQSYEILDYFYPNLVPRVSHLPAPWSPSLLSLQVRGRGPGNRLLSPMRACFAQPSQFSVRWAGGGRGGKLLDKQKKVRVFQNEIQCLCTFILILYPFYRVSEQPLDLGRSSRLLLPNEIFLLPSPFRGSVTLVKTNFGKNK